MDNVFLTSITGTMVQTEKIIIRLVSCLLQLLKIELS